MCHNIIDGRWHTPCGHFIAISTHRQDCQRPNCVFSRRHVHLIGCTSRSCIRLMDLPVRNPIRISPTSCADCTIRTTLQLMRS
ncbi:hypothetical protein NEOLEDRAFT_1155744 [Neolentinus lepideus HHB14362 ss-1]|uniref:Uncharacterized protein n=1 Tax=Neolentinus lepideus HHB14362 ss-1 TaxID=1314782 RepID=A0A165T6S0_9AGAM|nr:hypothetical protein NEOLEDRAFT_1155744 [Neolentinus lepideus HHB14362 ss-1]